MGGCRCSFRDCKVNTYNTPGMHFFHFPVKQTERYRQWRNYAKKEEMLGYNKVTQKNMVVCARHFRTEYFMNYKMERLTPSALPSIHRLSQTWAIDYEDEIENGILVTLEKPFQDHLIPPAGFECPLYMDNDEYLLNKLKELDALHIEGYERPDKMVDGESNEENTSKISSNSVQILETIQVSAPHPKRPRYEEEVPDQNKDFRGTNEKIILNQQILPIKTTQSTIGFNLSDVENLHIDDDILEIEVNAILGDDTLNAEDEDDNNVELIEIHNDDELQEDFESSDLNTTIVHLKSDHHNDQDNENLLEMFKTKLLAAQSQIEVLTKQNTDTDILHNKISQLENENFELTSELENCRIQNSNENIDSLKNELNKSKIENDLLQKKFDSFNCNIQSRDQKIKLLEELLNSHKASNLRDKDLKERFELELKEEHDKQLKTEAKLQQQISTLEESLELSRVQLTTNKNDLSAAKSNINDLQLEKLNLNKQNMEMEQNLQSLQNTHDTLKLEHQNVKDEYDSLHREYTNLENKYIKLEILHNQVATVTTSLENSHSPTVSTKNSQPTATSNSLTKAQLFNAIKRYISASMVSLLRMEMFGTSEREWKTDERQIAVDILRLGETVYKYLTDEWRFRLPALRDVRIWLSQSIEIVDEEDL